MRTLITYLLPLSLLGCIDMKIVCTDDAVASVVVSLTDEADEPIYGADLVVTDFGGYAEDCTEDDGVYFCGWEQDGVLTISAEADGFDGDELDVVVSSSKCGPITEEVSLALSID